ncbi:MAG: PucR family transcriptional regulator [Firmicutes bacterium]|nr:PucR family transcriptional regulator [Bacillota bacterium]
MKVTVEDCLKLDAFQGARVAAGKAELNNEVRSISVLDEADPEELKAAKPAKAEILLTSFAGIRGDADAQCGLVRQAAQQGCAALAVYRVGQAIRKLDDKVIRTAEEEDLPLLIMPETAGYSAAITGVMDRVLYGDNFRNSLISNTIFHLLNFEKHSNFQSAVKEAAINNDFQLILLSEDFNPVLTIETRHQATIQDAIRLGRERGVEGDSRVYTLIDVNGVLTYWGPVTIGSEKYYMFIVDNEDSYTAGEITKLAEIIRLAMGMWKYTPERDARSEFIKALIRGNKSLAYTLQEEAKIDGADIVCAFFSKGLAKDIESQLFADFEKKTDLEILKITENDETYGMILNVGDENQRLQQQGDCVTLFNKMKGNRKARIFHVTGLGSIEGAADAYKLINESWSFVQSVFPYKRVFTKYELTLVSNCINIQIQGGFVKKNYVELLEPFKETTDHKGKQLLDTLETFVLDAGMNSGKTAEFMDIHTNTVQYRLKKINEMLGVEITGNRVIPGLTMALALKRLERAVS